MQGLARFLSWTYLIIFLLVLYYPAQYYWWAGIFLTILVFIYFDAIMVRFRDHGWKLLGLPSWLIVLSWFYLLFWSAATVWQIIFVLFNMVVLSGLIKSLGKTHEVDFFLRNVVLYLLFLSFSVFYKIHIAWGVDIFYLSLVTIAVTVLLLHNYLLLTKTRFTRLHMVIVAMVIGVVNIELFWIMSYFPTSFFVNSGVVTIISGFFLELIVKNYNNELVSRRAFLTPLGIAISAVILVLASAQWY